MSAPDSAARPVPRKLGVALVILVAVVAVVAGVVVFLRSQGRGTTIAARPIAEGLTIPAGFTFAPDGRIFYGELRSGVIRIFNPRTSQNDLFFEVPGAKGQQGIFNVTFDPKYPRRPFMFAYVTRLVSGEPRNQIVRITDSGGTGTAMKVIFDGGETRGIHRGGRLLFGPDGMLYLVIGDRSIPRHAQNLRSASGKILRIAPDGGVPSDNPFPGSHVFAYGIRNSYGFVFDPATKRLWATENGPKCNDELNVILPGENYGWGDESRGCKARPAPPMNTNQAGPRPVLPKRFYPVTIAPAGAVFCVRCGLGAQSEGRLFWGAWNTGEIRRTTLNGSRTDVASEEIVYKHPSARFGGVMSMERGPDGALYFSDPNAIYKLELS